MSRRSVFVALVSCAAVACAERSEWPPAVDDGNVVDLAGTAIEPPDPPLGEVGAVSVSPSGRIAVIDLMAPAVYYWPEDGPPRQLGRHGSGPGEYRQPIALAWVDDSVLAVWDQATGRLNFFTPGERAVPSRAIEPPGDALGSGREDEPYGAGQVRRLQGAGAAAIFEWAESEHDAAAARESPLRVDDLGRRIIERHGTLIRFDADGEPAGSVLTFAAQPRFFRGPDVSSPPPLFSARLVWAAGDGFIVHSMSDEANVVATALDGDTIARIVWQPRRARLRTVDRENHGVAAYAENVWRIPAEARDMFTAERMKEMARALPAADIAPEFTTLEVVAGCVLISPFDSEGSSDGVADVRAVHRIDDGSLVGMLRIRDVARRGLHGSAAGLVGVARDSLDAPEVRVFPLSTAMADACAASLHSLRARLP